MELGTRTCASLLAFIISVRQYAVEGIPIDKYLQMTFRTITSGSVTHDLVKVGSLYERPLCIRYKQTPTGV